MSKLTKLLSSGFAVLALACLGIYGAGTTVNGTRVVNGDLTVKGTCTGCGAAVGGSTTQVLYNNAGAIAGITGATTNGTALTLVAPVLGTPASGTLTNTTGLPCATGITNGPGCMVEHHTCTAVATCDFTTGITSAYTEYVIKIQNLIPVDDGVAMRFRVHIVSGFDTGNNYSWSRLGFDGGGSSTAGGSSVGFFRLVENVSNTTQEGGESGTWYLSKPASTTAWKRVYGLGSTVASGGGFGSENSDGWYITTTAVDGFQVYFATGNIASGDVWLFGIVQ